MTAEYVVDYVGHGVIEYGDDQQARPAHSGLLHISLSEHCNERARNGWRLISVVGSTAGPLLFFERESRRLEMP